MNPFDPNNKPGESDAELTQKVHDHLGMIRTHTEIRDRWFRNTIALQDMTGNSTNLTIYHPSNGSFEQMTPQALKKFLGGRERFEEYMRNNHYFCKPIYDPSPTATKISLNEGNNIVKFNVYMPPSWRVDNFIIKKPLPSPLPSAPPPLIERFLKHLTNEHAPSYEYLLDWLANSLRTRNYTILVAIGGQGIGKGLLGDIIRGVHGAHNYVQVSDSVFKNRFNAQLENKTMVYVDEIELTEIEQFNRVKAVVNNDLQIERKGIDAATVKNFANFYFSSNHFHAIKLEEGDRRYSIIDLTETKAKEKFSIKELTTLSTSTSLHNQFALFLWGRQVDQTKMLVPFTDSPRYQDVKEATVSDWEFYVLERWVPHNAGRESVPYQRIVEEMQQAGVRMKYPPGRRAFVSLSKRYPDKLKVAASRSAGTYVVESAVKKPEPSQQMKRLIEGKE